MAAQAAGASMSDQELWRLACEGNVSAFELLVQRHQSLVCAVAYNACGNLALSEDVAQETFWTAWRERTSLKQADRLRSWLCGIARNLGRNAGRKAARRAAELESVAALESDAPGPDEEAVSREEESLVWQALEGIPETYREALILFYREDQSAAEVAAALGISDEAVRQRLARGRAMLRERVAGMVESGLRRSRPGRSLTVAVMTGLAAGAVSAKPVLAAGAGVGVGAGAGAGAAAAKAVGAGLTGGTLGGLFGGAFGLLGGWFGTWLPAQLAPTQRERERFLQTGRRMLVVSVLFLIAMALLVRVRALTGRPGYLAAWLAWFVAFEVYVLVESVRLARAVKRIRLEEGVPATPSTTPLASRVRGWAAHYRGRVYRSRATLLGWPLVDLNVSDPVVWAKPGKGPLERRIARGWIAVGDEARGLALAVGLSGVARGFIAIGGRALGVFSVGGLAAGVVSFGGLALGGLAVGGMACGLFALGGLAVGWQAAGGAALAWDVAAGGAAAARHAAFGGAAIARDYALGGGGAARHFNDPAAKELLLAHPLVVGMRRYAANATWISVALAALLVLAFASIRPLVYRRAGDEEPEQTREPEPDGPAHSQSQ